jgi:hypothetical protein
MKGKKIHRNMPMEKMAEKALQEAVAEVIADRKRTGDPLIVWRDGKVAHVPPEQIEIREMKAEYSLLRKKAKKYKT